MATENATVRPLPVQRKTRPIALETYKLKIPWLVCLRDIGIQIEQLIDISCIAGQVNHRTRSDGVTDRRVFAINLRYPDHYLHLFLSGRNAQLDVHSNDTAALHDHIVDLFRREARAVHYNLI